MAIEIGPEHPSVLINAGSLQEERGFLDKAIQLYERAYEIEPANSRTAELLTKLQRRVNSDVNLPKVLKI